MSRHYRSDKWTLSIQQRCFHRVPLNSRSEFSVHVQRRCPGRSPAFSTSTCRSRSKWQCQFFFLSFFLSLFLSFLSPVTDVLTAWPLQSLEKCPECIQNDLAFVLVFYEQGRIVGQPLRKEEQGGDRRNKKETGGGRWSHKEPSGARSG